MFASLALVRVKQTKRHATNMRDKRLIAAKPSKYRFHYDVFCLWCEIATAAGARCMLKHTHIRTDPHWKQNCRVWPFAINEWTKYHIGIRPFGLLSRSLRTRRVSTNDDERTTKWWSQSYCLFDIDDIVHPKWWRFLGFRFGQIELNVKILWAQSRSRNLICIFIHVHLPNKQTNEQLSMWGEKLGSEKRLKWGNYVLSIHNLAIYCLDVLFPFYYSLGLYTYVMLCYF